MTSISRSTSTSSTNNSTNALARAAVAFEYASLKQRGHCPLGMYIIPSPESLLVWDAAFFVHQGYYEDSIFKFRLTFPSTYPNHPPSVQFITDVFHPLVSQQNGKFNLASRFRPWRPKEHHVFDVLHWVKAAFKRQALDQIKDFDCLNKEAFRYHEQTSSFAALAKQSALLSQSPSALFEKDHPSMGGVARDSLHFRKLKPAQLQEYRAKLGLSDWEDTPGCEFIYVLAQS
ncbi:hypothetical protein HGRIS_009974 [Hohenbuehelia grisea]|uniref:UBC core domain-containing protein n=1 Tax=Hohenbuehelia grisea TaxID=104357 RepID=A0ABR3J2S7_9AGAR